jgi:hypothetical protein
MTIHSRAALHAASPRSTVEPMARRERFGAGIGRIWRGSRELLEDVVDGIVDGADLHDGVA